MSSRLFDGVNDLVSAGIVNNTGDCSSAIWCRPVDATPASTDHLSGFVESGDEGTHEKRLSIQTNGHVQAYIHDGAVETAEGTTVLSNDTWHHAAFTHDVGATSLKIFLDGTEEAENTGAGSSFSYTAPEFHIGSRDTVSGPFNGRLAWACFWNVVLTANEILAMARGMPPYRIRPKDQLICWPVWGLSAPEIDLSGNGRSGTVSGPTKANGPPVRLFTPTPGSIPLIEAAAAAVARRRVAVGAGWSTRR